MGISILPFVDRFPKDTELYRSDDHQAERGERRMMELDTIFCGDALNVLRTLPDKLRALLHHLAALLRAP